MVGSGARRPYGSNTSSPRELQAESWGRDGGARAARAARALHEQLVAYAHLVAGDPESRTGVWSEHSYARARDGTGAELRELLGAAQPASPAPCGAIDVEHVARSPTPPPLPALMAGEDDDRDDNALEEEAWEERVAAHAPSGVHARLARTAVDALRELQLARLAAAGVRNGGALLRREQARAAARRLRRAIAPLWAGCPRAAPWLHGALCAALPRRTRALYDEVLVELRRSVPRLAERFTPHLPALPPDPLEPAQDVRAEGGEAALVWVTAGGAADARWLRRLRPLLPTRELAAPHAERCLAPDRWCAAVAADVRAHLLDILTDMGSRFVVLGGAGAGAALGAALAAGAGAAGVRALLLLSPPLLTAEGPRDDPDDILYELKIPVLVVAGGGGAACGRGAAAELASRGSRRLLLLGGADDALRVPAALRRRLRLPQHALDAAVADECARWVRGLVRAHRELLERGEREGTELEVEEDDCGHLPAVTPRAAGTRLVSRVSGATPLALVPPRRVPDQLDAADILQLPIVFADDEPPALVPAGACGAAEGPAEGALTVRSGARGNLTRVIVARRGARPPRPAPPRHHRQHPRAPLP